ncbi:MAG: DMT family transporter [Alphaproteobacteria bacterium]
MAAPTQNIVLGMGFMLTATVFWSALDASAKFLIDLKSMPDMLVIWVRLFGGLVASYFIGALIDRRWDVWRVSRPWGQAWRSAFMAGTTVCNFIALGHLPITTTISIFFCAPLIVAALSQPMLGEQVGRLRWSAIVVGFVGVLVVMQPWGTGFSPWMLVSLGSAVFFALMQLTTRQLAEHDSAGSAVFYTTTVGAVGFLPLVFLLPGNIVTPPDLVSWAVLIAVGTVFGTLGHLFNVLAMHYAGPVRVAPFFYLAIVWMILFQTFLFGGNIRITTLIGAGIIISSGLFVFWREAYRARQKRAPA